MKPLALALVAFLLLGCTNGVMAYPPPVTRAEQATHSLTKEGSGEIKCTAVAIETDGSGSTHILLTGNHCLGEIDKLDVDGKPAKLTLVANDGNDHALVYSDVPFKHGARVGIHPKLSEVVFQLGHPEGLPWLVYREGYYSGKMPPMDMGVPLKAEKWNLWDLEGYNGDSGSGLWNERGEVVATFSIIHYSPDALFRMMVTLPYAFTKEQIKAAGINHGKHLEG